MRGCTLRGTTRVGTRFAPLSGMQTVEPSRWDDWVLAGLLLLISMPRLVIALLYDRPVGVEGTLSILFVVLALAILIRRNRQR